MNKRYIFLILLLILILGLGLWLYFEAYCSRDDSEQPLVILTPQESVPSPGPPTVLRLVLQFSDNEIELVSALPRRNGATEPLIDLDDLLAGKSLLLAYRGLGIEGEQVADGFIVMPLTARAEFQDPENENRLQSFEETLSDPLVRVSIPLDGKIDVLELSRLEPDSQAEFTQWERIPLGMIQITQ